MVPPGAGRGAGSVGRCPTSSRFFPGAGARRYAGHTHLVARDPEQSRGCGRLMPARSPGSGPTTPAAGAPTRRRGVAVVDPWLTSRLAVASGLGFAACLKLSVRSPDFLCEPMAFVEQATDVVVQ